VCPKCGAFLVIRKSRDGDDFYGCEKYPKCRFTKPKDLELKCVRSGCDGHLVHKLAKRRRFIGCDRYPQCDFTVFGQIDKTTPCPTCGNTWTTIRQQRGKPRVRKCPVPNCNYEEAFVEEE
jgi:DNA topoisomerase-1